MIVFVLKILLLERSAYAFVRSRVKSVTARAQTALGRYPTDEKVPCTIV